MQKIQELKEKIKKIYDKVEDKETLKEIASIDSDIDEIQNEHNSLVEENKELLKDYKDLYKYSDFKSTDKVDKGIETKKEFTYDEFLDDYIEKGKENNEKNES